MFNKKYKKRILEHEKDQKLLRELLRIKDQRAASLEKRLVDLGTEDQRFAALMRESLGLQIDFFASVKGLPPYFLDGLDEDDRKNFIIDMESIYSNERFQLVLRYLINVFAMNAIYKADKQQRDNGQIAVIAFEALTSQLTTMHKEFLSYKRNEDEDYDPLETLPS